MKRVAKADKFMGKLTQIDGLLIGSRAATAVLNEWPRRVKDWDIVTDPDTYQKFVGSDTRICSAAEIKSITPCGPGSAVEGGKSVVIDASLCRRFLVTMYDTNVIEFELDIGMFAESCKLMREYVCERPDSVIQLVNFYGMMLQPVGPQWLLALKWSHLYSGAHWGKTMTDFQWLRNKLCPKARSEAGLREWFSGFPGVVQFLDCRLEEMQKGNKPGYTKAGYSLDLSNDEFFEQSAAALRLTGHGRVFEHDDLHNVVSYSVAPMFTRIKDDQDRATCSERLFLKLTEHEKNQLVREEAMVIALERIVIPTLFKMRAITITRNNKVSTFRRMAAGFGRDAYRWALRRICTTLTRGWFRAHAAINYDELDEPDENFVELLRTEALQGHVRIVPEWAKSIEQFDTMTLPDVSEGEYEILDDEDDMEDIDSSSSEEFYEEPSEDDSSE